MANGSDGSIIIDTELDNTGAEKGLAKLHDTVKEVVTQIKTSGESIRQTITTTLPAIQNLTNAVDNLGDNMMDSFSQVIPLLQSIANATAQTSAQMAQTATQATDASGKMVASEKQVDQAARSAAEAVNQQGQSMGDFAESANAAQQGVNNATTSVTSYDKQLSRLQAKIDATRAKLAEYYKEVDAVKASTDIDLSHAATDEQTAAVLAIEDITLQSLNDKYAAQLKLLQQLESEHARIAALRQTAASAAGNASEGNNLVKGIQQAAAEVDKYQAKVSRMSHLRANASQWKAVQYDISLANQKLGQYRATLNALRTSGGIRSTDYERLSAILDTATQKASDLTSSLQPSAWAQFGGAMQSVASSAGSLSSIIGKAAFGLLSKGVQMATNKLKAFTSRAGKAAVSTKGLTRALTSIKTLLISRIRYTFISAIINGVKEGMQSLAKFSSSFDTAMSNIKNSSKELYSNLTVSFAGLIQAIEPILTRIINAVSTAVSYLNALFAMLGGKSTITIAKKQMDSYADATVGAAGAANDLKNQVYGFDELNKRSGDSNGGGAGNGSDLYEEVPINSLLTDNAADFFNRIKEAFLAGDWYGIGTIIANSLNAGISLVDAWFTNTLRPLGEKWSARIATALNGLTDTLDWGQLGAGFASGINAMFGTVNKFFTTYGFENIGRGFAESVNGLFSNVEWGLVGQTFANHWNALIDSIYGFVSNTNWPNIGESFAVVVSDFGNSLKLETLSEGIGRGINGIFDTIGATINGTNWNGLAEKISAAINNLFLTVDWETASAIFVEGINIILSSIATMIANVDWYTIGTVLFSGFETLFVGLDWGNLGSILGNSLVALLQLLVAWVAGMDWGALAQAFLVGIGDAVAEINWLGILAELASGLTAVILQIPSIITGEFAGGLSGILSGLFETVGLDCVAGFFDGICAAISTATAWLKSNLVDPVIDGVRKLFGINSPSTVFAEIGDCLIQGLLMGIEEAWKSIVHFFDGKIPDLSTSIAKGWNDIKNKATSAWNNIKSTVSSSFNGLRTNLISTANGIKTFLLDSFNSLKSTLGNINWRSIGTNLVSGVKSGISNAWSSFKGWVLGKFDGLVSGVKTFLGINSPSTVFAAIGTFLMYGLQEGIEGTEGDVISTVSNLAKSMNKEMGLATPALEVSEVNLISDLDRVATRLTGIAATFRIITDALATIGGFRMPQIAAGTVVPVKTKIDSAADNPERNSLALFASDVDERLADQSYILRQILDLLQRLNITIDIDALTQAITLRQRDIARGYGGV